MARYLEDTVAIGDRDLNSATLNNPDNAWTPAEIATEQTALTQAGLGITARITTATGDYVKVKWFYNNKPLAIYKSRNYVQAEALAFLETVKDEHDVWSTLGVASVSAIAAVIDDASLAPAGTGQLTVTATGTRTDTDVTAESTYWSSDDEIATVDAAGEVTAVADGVATITAKFRNLTDTVEVTVATP